MKNLKLMALILAGSLLGTTAAVAEEPGMRVVTITEGSGPTPAATDTVTVHYRGTFLDGTEFDSSHKRGPTTFNLGSVIPCWTAGLMQMRVGETAQLVCHPDLAYGAQGVPGVIPPNSVLVFEVQLLGLRR